MIAQIATVVGLGASGAALGVAAARLKARNRADADLLASLRTQAERQDGIAQDPERAIVAAALDDTPVGARVNLSSLPASVRARYGLDAALVTAERGLTGDLAAARIIQGKRDAILSQLVPELRRDAQTEQARKDQAQNAAAYVAAGGEGVLADRGQAAISERSSLYHLNELDKRYAPKILARILERMGGEANALRGFGDRPTTQDIKLSPRSVNDAWAFGTWSAGRAPASMPQDRRAMCPIYFRRFLVESLADALDPDAPFDSLGAGTMLDDQTGQILRDFGGWAGTYSITQSEVENIITFRRKPPKKTFWDSVWDGMVGSFKNVLSLDWGGTLDQVWTGVNLADLVLPQRLGLKLAMPIPANILSWAGSGFAGGGNKTSAPNPAPLSPEDKRIAAWLTSTYLVVPPVGGLRVGSGYGWVLRADLALSGVWPILDVFREACGGVNNFERAFMFATLASGEQVIQGSRDQYVEPGQLALRAVVVARRILGGVEDRYQYGPSTLVSLVQQSSTTAPTKAWWQKARGEWLAGINSKPPAIGASTANPSNAYGVRAAVSTAEGFGTFLQIPAGPVPNSYRDLIRPPAYDRWGIAGFVPASGKIWLSDSDVADMMARAPMSVLSLTPQGQATLSLNGL